MKMPRQNFYFEIFNKIHGKQQINNHSMKNMIY